MFLSMITRLAGLILGFFLLKVILVMVAVQVSLAYNAIIGRNVEAKYERVNTIPDWVKTLADGNIYQRYSIDPPRIVTYPAFYRNGFKFFNRSQDQYAVSYDGTGKYTVYRKLMPETSGSKTKSVVEKKSKIKV